MRNFRVVNVIIVQFVAQNFDSAHNFVKGDALHATIPFFDLKFQKLVKNSEKNISEILIIDFNKAKPSTVVTPNKATLNKAKIALFVQKSED